MVAGLRTVLHRLEPGAVTIDIDLPVADLLLAILAIDFRAIIFLITVATLGNRGDGGNTGGYNSCLADEFTKIVIVLLPVTVVVSVVVSIVVTGAIAIATRAAIVAVVDDDDIWTLARSVTNTTAAIDARVRA